MTTAVASGAIETPLNSNKMIKRKNNIIEKIAKKVLREFYIYNVDPSKYASKRENLEGLNDYQNSNLEDKGTGYVNPIQNDDLNVEAHQNGMLDIDYASLSDKAKENITNAVKAGDKELGNSIPSKTGEKLLKDASKRNKRMDKTFDKKYMQLGSDVEIKAEPTSSKTKTVTENTMKKYKFNNSIFLKESEVKKVIKSLPNSVLQENNQFFIEDKLQNRYKIIVELGTPIVLESFNVKKEEEKKQSLIRLMTYNGEEKKSTINENETFKTILSKTKQLINEG